MELYLVGLVSAASQNKPCMYRESTLFADHAVTIVYLDSHNYVLWTQLTYQQQQQQTNKTCDSTETRKQHVGLLLSHQ